MMRKEYHKLVRDRIPEIIKNNGINCEFVTMTNSEYYQALQQKLLEESQEAATASPEDLVTELADIYEVIDTIMEIYGISHEMVISAQMQRRQERGGFHNKIKLLWTE